MHVFLIELREGLGIALRAIRTNLTRSMLTTLGIIVGIVAVTSMFTTINGIERAFERSMDMIGTNVLYVDKWPWIGSDEEWWEIINRPEIKLEVVEAIEKQSRYAVAVAPVTATQRPVRYRDRTVSGAFIIGSTPEFSKIRDVELTDGRIFNALDLHGARRACIVGSEVASGLFPVETPLGKKVRVGAHSCEVIGVLAEQGKFLGLMSFDSQILMPITTFRSMFGMSRRGVRVDVKVGSSEDLGVARDELVGIVRAARRLDPGEPDNFAINQQEAFRQQFDATKVVIYGIGLFLTALALVVGGIGVMNIMFVSVKERTREIGIRKAVGARSRAIMMQFLLEAIFVCMAGGLIGVAISYGVTQVINAFFTAVLSPGTVILAFSICAGIGIIFGFVPARTAARSNPIDALHQE
jgi:putative ABC transport system permease protein